MPENMTSKSSVFPQELLDMILENLSTDGRSLSSCSLVSRDWFSPARRVHFRDTRITKTGKYVIDGTLTAFLSSSSVGRYILKLRLECSVRNFGLLELNHLSFASLLPFLPSLRFLSLTRIVWFDSTPESNVPTTLPNVSPPLQELTLDRSLFYTARESSPIPLLVDLLTLFPPLRHIRILNPAITPNHPVSQDLRPILSTFNTSSSVLRALQLESATFFTPYLHIFFAILTASGSMGTLQSLDASCFNPLHISRLQSFINKINLTLKHIRIVWPKSFPGDPNYGTSLNKPQSVSFEH